jgi:hypothetical protein
VDCTLWQAFGPDTTEESSCCCETLSSLLLHTRNSCVWYKVAVASAALLQLALRLTTHRQHLPACWNAVVRKNPSYSALPPALLLKHTALHAVVTAVTSCAALP